MLISTCNPDNIINEIFYFTFRFRNSVCLLHFQHILIQTNHMSGAQKPHVARGLGIE